MILSNSGGAATAISRYFDDGIDGVEDKFRGAPRVQKLPAPSFQLPSLTDLLPQHLSPRKPFSGQESVLANIQLLHEAYRCKLITLFELDDEENQGSPPDLSHALLEALIKASKTTPDHAMLPAGASLRHPVYGLGKMIEVQGDGRRHVTFGDTGEVRVFASRSGSEEGLSTMPIFNLTEVDATLAEQAASNKSFARTNRPFSGSSREWHLPEATVASSRHSQFDTLLSKALTLTVVWNRPKVRCNDSLFRTIVVMPPASKRVRPLVMPPAPPRVIPLTDYTFPRSAGPQGSQHDARGFVSRGWHSG